MNIDYSWGAQNITGNEPSRQLRTVPIAKGMVLEDATSGWVGEAIKLERVGGSIYVVLENQKGRRKNFPLGLGFLLYGEPVNVVPPQQKQAREKKISNSGSVFVDNLRAKEAKQSRIWVEGLHDAALVEKIWGHDLRVEGIVVEPLHGADNLAELVAAFEPGPAKKLGILLDHMVEGSKETKIAQQVLSNPRFAPYVHIIGHPFIDIWAAIKPAKLGFTQWPEVPRGEDWKTGTLQRLGLPHSNPEDISNAWRNFLSKVEYFSDLEPQLLGRVEELIDFVTV